MIKTMNMNNAREVISMYPEFHYAQELAGLSPADEVWNIVHHDVAPVMGHVMYMIKYDRGESVT
jgi:hypothetical protein